MNLITCFQEIVGDFYLPFSKEENELFASRALELKDKFPMEANWLCNTYSTLNSGYSLFNDPLFSRLIDECGRAVKAFAVQFDVKTPIVCKDAWLNVAEPGGFQEFHNHSNSHFSAVYYICAKPNSGKLVFKNHATFSDMFPLPRFDTNKYNYSYYYFQPVASRLLVFRSNLQHMVALNKSLEPRIGVSFNYVVQPEVTTGAMA